MGLGLLGLGYTLNTSLDFKNNYFQMHVLLQVPFSILSTLFSGLCN